MDEAEKEYRVEITEDANIKIAAHLEFLAHVSESAAERLRSIIRAGIATLTKNPQRQLRYETPIDTSLELRKKMCGKRYRIVFSVSKNTVTILDVQDCRQDTDKNIV
jgi:plasmid stabilization system protein ParE